MIKENEKKIIVLLLLLSCMLSGIILTSTSEAKIYRLNYENELDSLIHHRFYQSGLQSQFINEYTINVDSVLTRKIYRIEVPSQFTKTLFHFNLHKDLYPYGIKVPGKVHFPERDMDLYVYDNETVLRTIRLITNTELDSIYSTGK